MNKKELMDIIAKLPEKCNVNIDITPILKEVQPKEKEILKWNDLEKIEGYWIDDCGKIKNLLKIDNSSINRNVFATEKQAKSALAMAQLSQVLPHYCEPMTDEAWFDTDKPKWNIIRSRNDLLITDSYANYYFLAFHTKEQAELFLQNNEQLIRQYYML